MLKLNTIETDIVYYSHGFTLEEIPLIRKHDELFNEYTLKDCWDAICDDDDNEFWKIQKLLDL